MDKKIGGENEGLALLREPFQKNQIGKLPKPTKRQTEEVRADFKKGVRCDVCGGWHHPKVVHLDYVGHAALTDRLLDADIEWNWEPCSVDVYGLPLFDSTGGLWIKLTVCGVTRAGYGFPDGKKGGDAIKEAIGDALRNAAMRFGAALDLWHKGDLHVEDDDGNAASKPENAKPEATADTEHKNGFQKYLSVMADMKKHLTQQYGESAYYDILGKHGVKHANEIKERNLQLNVFREMSQYNNEGDKDDV